MPIQETVNPNPAFDETATAWLKEDLSVLLLSYILQIHFAPVTNPDKEPKITAEEYILQMPNKFNGDNFSAFLYMLRVEQLTRNKDITINGNIDGIRVFEQKIIVFTILSDIYFAFVKNI